MDRKTKRLFGTLFAAMIVLLITALQENGTAKPEPGTGHAVQAATSTAQAVTSTNALVVRAVDGDTIEVRMDGETESVKVRLLGVNTPESVDPRRPVQCFGKEASKFVATLVQSKRARMEADPEADERDKYGRLLRNVVLEDGTDLNAELIRSGYAYAYLTYPLNKQRKIQLRRLEEEAKAALRGLWNPDTCNGLK